MGYKYQVVQLYGQGVVRLEGRNLDDSGAESNMAGKSTIIEAIVWCLFNRTIRGLRPTDVPRRGSSGDCRVSVYFRASNALCRVTRTRQSTLSAGNPSLGIIYSGHILTCRHEVETQAKLEAILGFDYQTFVNSVIFGGVKPFASLTDAEQKKVLESFLHFEQVDRALAKTRTRLAQVDESLSGLRLKIQDQQNLIREVKAQIDSSSEVNRNIEEECRGIRKELNNLEDVRPYLKKLQRKQRYFSSLQEKKSRLLGQRENLQEKLNEIQESLKSKDALIGKECPICGRIVSENTVEAIIRHLTSEASILKNRIYTRTNTIAQLERSLTVAAREVTVLSGKQKQYEVTTRRKAELRERLEGLAQIVPLNRSLEYKYSRAVARYLGMQGKKAELEQEHKDLSFWEIGFGNKGIKAMIVRKALPWLNQTLEEYAEKVFGESVSLKFSAARELKSGEERELFHVDYHTKRGAGNYIGESAGGRKRIDICVLLTFAALSQVTNLLLVDELLDSLDEVGRESVLEILGSLRGTVLVISHRRELKARIGKVWTVIKQNGVSKIV